MIQNFFPNILFDRFNESYGRIHEVEYFFLDQRTHLYREGEEFMYHKPDSTWYQTQVQLI